MNVQRENLFHCQHQAAQLEAEVERLRQDNERLQRSDRSSPIPADSKHTHSQWFSTIATVANLLLRSSDYNTVLPDVVRLLGEAVGSDRCGIGQNILHPTSGKTAVRTLPEWCKTGTLHSEEFSPHSDRLFLWENDAPYIAQQLVRGEVINCLVADLPEPDRSLLSAQGNTAELFVPILINQQYWGYIAFDNCNELRLYDDAEIAILRIVADSLAAAIERQAKDEELRESEQHYRQLMELASEGIYRYQFEEPMPIHLPSEEKVRWLYQHFQIVEHNLGFAEMYGYDRADALIGLRLTDFHGNVTDNTANMTKLFEDGHRARNLETVEIDRFGRKKYFLINIFDIIKDRFAVGGWGTQIDITELREAQQALLQAEQERTRSAAGRSQELERINTELQQTLRQLEARDRLLEATAAATNVLLTLGNFDTAIDTALKILVEGSGCDRINILENSFDTSPVPTYITVIYEWARPGIIRQLSSPESGQISSEGIEAFLERYYLRGDGFGGLLDEWDEPLRSAFAAVWVKSSYSVPIRVKGQWWGALCLDYCQSAIRVSPAEVAVLRTIADCIGSAIQRDRTQKAILQAERARSQELQRINAELQQILCQLEARDRILEVTATSTNALLTTENLDEAINTALQILGEGLDTDRVNIAENFNASPDELFPSWRVLYEWDSPQTVSQQSHLVTGEGSYAEIEWLYELFQRGESASYRIEETPEPFRSEQIEIGVKSTHIVPIYIEGNWWGVVGFDDCREVRRRSLAELAVLKTAAACIGSAIQRDRTQKAILQAEQARSQELQRLNTELQQTIDRLTESEKDFRTLFELSSEGLYFGRAEPPIPITLLIEEQCELLYQNFRVVKANPAFAAMYGAKHPDEMVGMGNPDCHVEGSEKNQAFIRGIVESGYNFRNLETEEIDRHGQIRYFLNSGFGVIKENLYVGGWATQIDVTELREAQQARLQAERQRSQELERINTELQQTLDRLSESEERYRTLFEISSEGIFRFEFEPPIPIDLSIDEQVALMYCHLRFAEANQTFAAMYNASSPEDLIGIRLTDVHVKESEKNLTMMQAVAENGYQLRNAEIEEVDLHGNSRYFLNNITTMIKDGCAIGGWASQLDITELRLAQQALLQAEQDRVAELAKTNQALKNNLDRLAAEPNLEAFLGHVLTEISQQLEMHTAWLFLYNPQDQTLQLNNWVDRGNVQPQHRFTDLGPLTELFLSDTTPIWTLLLQTKFPFVITQDNAAQFMFSGTEDWQLQWADRHGLQSGINILLSVGDKPLGLLGLLSAHRSEFTSEELELVQALSQQATLAIQLTQLATEAQQSAIFEERNRLAGEIHDTLAQTFTGISVQLELVNYLIAQATPEVSSILDRISTLAQTGLNEARRSVWSIYPAGEDYANLAQKLTDCVQQLTCSTELQTQVNISGEPYPLSSFLGTNLFRIGQEAIANALKHAQASQLSIELTYTPMQVSLCIKDNGCSFNPQAQTEGFGLISISERTDRIGGQLRIMTQPGLGTEIFVQVPV
jgi:PAS domain S-box-containing protein